MLESLPAPFPLAPHLNAHARADRNSLAIRRMWTDLVDRPLAARLLTAGPVTG